MVSQINNLSEFINESSKDEQSKTTISNFSPNVLQILTDINCTPPKALFSLENDIAYLKDKSKISIIDKMLLVTGIVFTIASIAAAIFGQLLLASSLAILVMIAVKKRLSSLDTDDSIDRRVEKIKTDADLVGQWLKQINVIRKQNNLSQEQLKAVDEAFSFCVSKLQSAALISK